VLAPRAGLAFVVTRFGLPVVETEAAIVSVFLLRTDVPLELARGGVLVRGGQLPAPSASASSAASNSWL
jgi:hypothetical protein